MLGKAYCLYLVICLYGGIIITLFIRAFVRRRLLKDYEALKAEDSTTVISNRLLKPILVIPRQIQALRQLDISIAEAPAPVQRRFRYFRMLTLITVIQLVLLVIFSFLAQKLCGT